MDLPDEADIEQGILYALPEAYSAPAAAFGLDALPAPSHPAAPPAERPADPPAAPASAAGEEDRYSSSDSGSSISEVTDSSDASPDEAASPSHVT